MGVSQFRGWVETVAQMIFPRPVNQTALWYISGDLSALHLVLDQALRWFEIVDGSQRLHTGDVEALDVFTEPGL